MVPAPAFPRVETPGYQLSPLRGGRPFGPETQHHCEDMQRPGALGELSAVGILGGAATGLELERSRP